MEELYVRRRPGNLSAAIYLMHAKVAKPRRTHQIRHLRCGANGQRDRCGVTGTNRTHPRPASATCSTRFLPCCPTPAPEELEPRAEWWLGYASRPSSRGVQTRQHLLGRRSAGRLSGCAYLAPCVSILGSRANIRALSPRRSMSGRPLALYQP